MECCGWCLCGRIVADCVVNVDGGLPLAGNPDFLAGSENISVEILWSYLRWRAVAGASEMRFFASLRMRTIAEAKATARTGNSEIQGSFDLALRACAQDDDNVKGSCKRNDECGGKDECSCKDECGGKDECSCKSLSPSGISKRDNCKARRRQLQLSDKRGDS